MRIGLGTWHSSFTFILSLQVFVVRIIILVLLISAHTPSCTRVLLIELLENGLRDVVKLLLFLFVIIPIGIWVVVQPVDGIIGRLKQCLLILVAQSSSQFLLIVQLVLQIIRCTLQLVLGLHSLRHSCIFL